VILPYRRTGVGTNGYIVDLSWCNRTTWRGYKTIHAAAAASHRDTEN